jgi:hypothetical protein
VQEEWLLCKKKEPDQLLLKPDIQEKGRRHETKA